MKRVRNENGGIYMHQPSLYLVNRAAMFETYGGKVDILYRHTLPGCELTTDVFYFGKVTKGKVRRPICNNIVVVISGTHGLEGAAGSYVQLKLDEKIQALKGSDTGVVFIHALNPYGYHYGRRVDANNIDVNRAGGTEFITRSAYSSIRHVVEPEVWSAQSVVAIWELMDDSTKAREFQAAVMGGQYDVPQGLFYGGQENQCWSIQTLKQIITDLCLSQWFFQRPQRISVIDIHTGLGNYGQGEIYSPALNKADYLAERTQHWLGDLGSEVLFPLAKDKNSSSAPIAGDILSALVRFLPQAMLMPIAIELGTTMSVSELIKLSVAENWIHHHPGQLSMAEEQAIQNQLSGGFFPKDDAKWLNLIWERCAAVFDACVREMQRSTVNHEQWLVLPRAPWT